MGIAARAYGLAPCALAVLHGGPGAAGDADDLARALAVSRGVLAPRQRADSVDGQIAELAADLAHHVTGPAVLIGHGWGALLALLCAARHPTAVARVIAVGCPPLTPAAVAAAGAARTARLDAAGRREAGELARLLATPAPPAPATLARVARLFARTDAHALLPAPEAAIDPAIHAAIAGEIAGLRAAGLLLERLAGVRCPVLAVHGARDPHRLADLRGALGVRVPGARFALLAASGPTPWRERDARAAFFALIEEELATPAG